MKPIEETHPSVVAYDKNVAPIYSDDDRICMAYSVQKHTIDKAVLKEKALQVIKELKVPLSEIYHPDAEDGIDLLMSKLGLED